MDQSGHHSISDTNTTNLVKFYDIVLTDFLCQTNQAHLPQVKLMKDAKDILADCGVHEIYMRGSFTFGEADHNSDIDYFSVVDVHQLSDTVSKFTKRLSENYYIILEAYDDVVDPYGGVGFTYILADKQCENVFIFDSYYAIKGKKPQKELFECPRIHAKEPSYTWTDDPKATARTPKVLKQFRENFEQPQSKSEHLKMLFQQNMIVNATMIKHIERGQIVRVANDSWHMLGNCIQMLQVALGRNSYRSPYYTGDQLIKDCLQSDNPQELSLGKKLKSLSENPLHQHNPEILFLLCVDILKRLSPEAYEALKPRIDMHQSIYIDKDLSAPCAETKLNL